MIVKYSWLLYKRIMTFNILLSIHYILVIPFMGFIVYFFFKISEECFFESTLSYVLFYMFMFQTILIFGKRIKNEFFFSSRCYTIFPYKKEEIFFYTLIFGIIDLNVILYIMVTLGMIIYATNWSFIIYLVFILIFLVSEMAYLIYMMGIIEFIIEKYGTSKNLFLFTFFPFMFLELYTRLAENFYLFDYYPISGWIGSTIQSAQKGDINQVLFYFGVVILSVIIGLFLLNRISYPRKNNVF